MRVIRARLLGLIFIPALVLRVTVILPTGAITALSTAVT